MCFACFNEDMQDAFEKQGHYEECVVFRKKSCTVNQTAHHLSSIHGPFHLIEMDEHQRWDYMEI